MSSFAKLLKLDLKDSEKRLIIFDELRKYYQWKSWLKGFFDTYHKRVSIIVTGSAMLNVYQSGGDSMMGRYYLYHIHPLSVAELLGRPTANTELNPPSKIDEHVFKNLIQFGGFPEPFQDANYSQFNQWSLIRESQLFREDLRDLTNIKELSQVRVQAHILKDQVGKNTSYLSLSNKIKATSPTVKRWVEMLSYIYYCFEVKPWSKNITRSLIKEPKYYLWDWSQVSDGGAQKENFVASHLLKAVHHWTDIGLGVYDLYYLRDKDKREVDFLVTRNHSP